MQLLSISLLLTGNAGENKANHEVFRTANVVPSPTHSNKAFDNHFGREAKQIIQTFLSCTRFSSTRRTFAKRLKTLSQSKLFRPHVGKRRIFVIECKFKCTCEWCQLYFNNYYFRVLFFKLVHSPFHFFVVITQKERKVTKH